MPTTAAVTMKMASCFLSFNLFSFCLSVGLLLLFISWTVVPGYDRVIKKTLPACHGSRYKAISTTIITTTAPIISEVESGVFKKFLSLFLRIFLNFGLTLSY